MKFENKTVLITGGARGQGRNHALAFAARGANVALLDSIEGEIPSASYDMATREDLDQTRVDVEKAGAKCLTVVGDVRKTQDVDDAVAKTVEEFGGVDIVIANAGIFALAPATDVSDDVWSDVIDINLSGVFRTVRAAARHMKDAGTAGRIITISSMAGRMAFPNAVAYTSAKFGVIGMTKTFAEDLGASGITVNAVCPTNVNTPMIRDNPDAHALFTGKDNPSEEEIKEGAEQFTSQGVPWVEPDDITNAVLFLAADTSRYITGEALTVSAGQINANAA